MATDKIEMVPTPGPWFRRDNYVYVDVGDRKQLVAQASTMRGISTAFANAQVIAAAWEMKEALGKAADQFEFYAREHRAKADLQPSEAKGPALTKANTNEQFAAMCRAALAKATA